MPTVMIEQATVQLVNDTHSSFEQNNTTIIYHESGEITLTPGNECTIGGSLGILKGSFEQGKKYQLRFFDSQPSYRFTKFQAPQEVGYIELA